MPLATPKYVPPWERENWLILNRGKKLYAIQEWQSWRALRGMEAGRLPPSVAREVKRPQHFISKKALNIFKRLHGLDADIAVPDGDQSRGRLLDTEPTGAENRAPTGTRQTTPAPANPSRASTSTGTQVRMASLSTKANLGGVRQNAPFNAHAFDQIKEMLGDSLCFHICNKPYHLIANPDFKE